MSFYSNFQSDRIPGQLTGNPLSGLCEKVCVQTQRIFDACIKQTQVENYVITLTDNTPATVTYPLTFISARTTSSVGNITSQTVERLPDRQNCARVRVTVEIPIEVAYTDASGTDGVANATLTVGEDVILSVPGPSLIPYQLTAIVSAVAANGTYTAENQFTIDACITVILKVAIEVELLIPAYGYCAIPPAQEFSQEVCSGFFELPLYPEFR